MKRLVLLLNLLALPAAAQQVSIPHTTFTLPNGLRVIVAEDHSTPVAAVNVWYHVGSGYEKPGRTGFAHLFEHVMFEGSQNVKEGDFDNFLEAATASGCACAPLVEITSGLRLSRSASGCAVRRVRCHWEVMIASTPACRSSS
ncbi:MAG TPA: insulinase family protein, partial [Longimicrobium sp.]|nr:insulinase family protein [Longimicrobium sp.]